jgi:hypothetical protein
MAHTLCVAAAQESAIQIADFPARLKREAPLDGDVMIVVERLDDLLTDCYQRGILPAEHPEATWARAGTRVDVDPSNPPARANGSAVSVQTYPSAVAGAANISPGTPIAGA